MMYHGTSRVTRMNNPDGWFAKVITWIDDSSNMSKRNDILFTPILNAEVWGLNMTGTFGGVA